MWISYRHRDRHSPILRACELIVSGLEDDTHLAPLGKDHESHNLQQEWNVSGSRPNLEALPDLRQPTLGVSSIVETIASRLH